MKTTIKTIPLLCATLIVSLGLFSCKDSSTGTVTEPTQTHTPHSGAMIAGLGFEIDNNCPLAIDSITVGMSGTRQNLSIGAYTEQTFTVESDVTAMEIYGQQIFANSETIIYLPDGTKVKVTWIGNIVVVDTLTLI